MSVPALGNVYEFELDEDTELRVLAEEMMEVICHREHCPLLGAPEQLLLLHNDIKRILKSNQTLVQAGVKAGDRLTVV